MTAQKTMNRKSENNLNDNTKLSDRAIKPRWWRTAHGRVCVQFPEGSVYEKVMSHFALKKIGNETYIFTPNLKTVNTLEKFFDQVNNKLKKDFNISDRDLFSKKGSLSVKRTFEELQNMPISECNTVKSFRMPAYLKKKNVSVVDSLKDVGIESVFDMLLYTPRRHIDRTNPIENFDNILDGEEVIVMGKIVNSYVARGKFSRTIITLRIKNSNIDVVFFNQPWITRAFSVGKEVIVTGKYKIFRDKGQINGATIENNSDSAKPIVPIYKQSPKKGLTTKFFEQLADEALREAGNIPTPLYMDNRIAPNIASILRKVHSPQSMEEHKQAQEDMALFELSLLQTIIQNENSLNPKAKTVVSSKNPDNPILRDMLENHIPFSLTDDQKNAVSTVVKEMASGNADNILLSADVGAGKTIIAQLAAIRAVEAGNQAVLAAPTEVLARQLYEKTVDLVSYRDDIKVVFMSGSTKAKERKELEKEIKAGNIHIVVGTHVVLTKYEMYQSLGFVCIDEQHKFGAKQRTAISEALSQHDNGTPVVMQQTATPIPRSMAQSMFGSITMLRIKQKPSGRKPIKTKWVNAQPSAVMETNNNGVWKAMKKEIKAGNQAFIIAPFVTDSEFMEDVSSVESLYKELKELFPQMKNRIAIIHGKMKAESIEETMKKVRAKEYDIVVASTVVEVGVDIPDATFIAIMSADRLGIASLHQLRGRVGRNSKQSYCVLVARAQTEVAATRLTAMENSNDGFELAEEDLKNRGAGLLLGSKQSGDSEMKFATNALNPELLQSAYEIACNVIFSPEKARALNDAELYFGTDLTSSDFNSLLI